MMYGSGLWMGGVVMMLFWVLVIVAIVWAVVYVARRSSRTNPGTPHIDTPLDVVKRRYAAGEINREQFEEMKHNLGA